jgi:hypothetical protein
VVLSARHLKRILAAYFRYYHRSRPHFVRLAYPCGEPAERLGLEKQCPRERQIMKLGQIIEIAELGVFTIATNVPLRDWTHFWRTTTHIKWLECTHFAFVNGLEHLTRPVQRMPAARSLFRRR